VHAQIPPLSALLCKMNYEEEQSNELEALESIYGGDFERKSSGPPYKIMVAVDPEAASRREGISAEPVRLEITFPPNYPDEVPDIAVKYTHILPKHAEALKRHLLSEAEGLKGMVMVFMLVNAAKEYLESNQLSAAQDWGADEEEEGDEHHHADNDARKRFKAGLLKGIVGVTPVTEQTFLAWRAKFEAEQEAIKGEMTLEMKEKLSRPTGRQLFERDASLYLDTDVGYNDAQLFEDEDLPDDEEDEDEDDEDEEESGEEEDEEEFDRALFLDDDLPSDEDDDDDDDDDDYKPGR